MCFVIPLFHRPLLQSVDYKALSQSPCFKRYCELAVQLQHVELLSLSREEKLAFFINIYNALVIHGNLRLGFPKNMWQRYRVRDDTSVESCLLNPFILAQGLLLFIMTHFLKSHLKTHLQLI